MPGELRTRRGEPPPFPTIPLKGLPRAAFFSPFSFPSLVWPILPLSATRAFWLMDLHAGCSWLAFFCVLFVGAFSLLLFSWVLRHSVYGAGLFLEIFWAVLFVLSCVRTFGSWPSWLDARNRLWLCNKKTRLLLCARRSFVPCALRSVPCGFLAPPSLLSRSLLYSPCSFVCLLPPKHDL